MSESYDTRDLDVLDSATREPERAGRVMDRESEDSFGRLRAAGPM